jgi:hypothetical protein
MPSSPRGVAGPQSLQDPQSTLGSPFHTPPTSPSTPGGGLPSIIVVDHDGESQQPVQRQEHDEDLHTVDSVNSVMVSVSDIASRDVVAIADLFSKMKKALVTMSGAFDRLGSQTEKMVSHSLDIKLRDQVRADPTLSNNSFTECISGPAS